MDLETPITTQEQFDEAVKERLARESKKYEGYTSPKDLEGIKAGYEKQVGDLNAALTAANEKAAKYDADIAERDAKIKGYETSSVKMRIAHETGLPYEMHTRLSGETEEEIRKDAQELAKLMKPAGPAAPPMANLEPQAGKGSDAALKGMLQKMNSTSE